MGSAATGWYAFAMKSVLSTCLAVLLMLGAPSAPARPTAQTQPLVPAAGVDEAADGSLEQVIAERLEFYNRHFPGIRFVVLAGGDQWLDSLSTLYTLLGKDSTNLDYECPVDLRKDLLALCVARVKMMLMDSESSATLFRVGVNSLSDRPVLCVVTLDARGMARDDFHATRHLIPLGDAVVRRIPRDHWLAHREYLAFVIDHEVFHCLDSYHNRPIPRSSKEQWAQYMGFYNENGADAFAMAMHLRRYGRVTRFARDLLRIRGIALYGGNANHFTYGALDRVLQAPVSRLESMGVMNVLKYASELRDAVVPDYDRYLAYRARARQASRVLADPDRPAGGSKLVAVSRACFNELFDLTSPASETRCAPR
jgi:hypothetical protein